MPECAARLNPPMRTDEIHPGDLIAGKYRVRAILGRGHGLLVEGFHTEFDQRVVIKILLAGHGDEREIERFRREARTLAKLLVWDHTPVERRAERRQFRRGICGHQDGVTMSAWMGRPLPHDFEQIAADAGAAATEFAPVDCDVQRPISHVGSVG